MSRHVQRANVSKSTRFLGGNAHHALPRRELDFASGSAMANKTIGISDELAAHVVEVDTRTPGMRTRTPSTRSTRRAPATNGSRSACFRLPMV